MGQDWLKMGHFRLINMKNQITGRSTTFDTTTCNQNPRPYIWIYNNRYFYFATTFTKRIKSAQMTYDNNYCIPLLANADIPSSWRIFCQMVWILDVPLYLKAVRYKREPLLYVNGDDNAYTSTLYSICFFSEIGIKYQKANSTIWQCYAIVYQYKHDRLIILFMFQGFFLPLIFGRVGCHIRL